jgi:hypothetical protein
LAFATSLLICAAAVCAQEICAANDATHKKKIAEKRYVQRRT